MAVTTTNLGVITAYGDAVAAGYTGTKAEWQALMASYATVGQQAVDAKNDAVAAKNTAVSKATEATTAASTATTKANEASDSAQSIAQSAAQIQENTDDIEQLKSEFTALESDGVVPSAEQILTDKGVTDSVPYHYRKTGGDGADRLYDQIVGGTVCFNQLCPAYSKSGTAVSGFNEGTTLVANHKMLLSYKRDGNTANTFVGIYTRADGQNLYFNLSLLPDGALSGATVKNVAVGGVSDGTADNKEGNVWIYQESQSMVTNIMLIDLTAMFGSNIADYIYSLEQTNAGAGVALFKSLFPNDYYPYNAGELVSVSGLSEHKMVGFNAWDEEYVLNSTINPDTGAGMAGDKNIRSKNYIPVIPNTDYYIKSNTPVVIVGYDANMEYVGIIKYGNPNSAFATNKNGVAIHYIMFGTYGNTYGTTYNHDICINLSDPAKNGTYEPYKAHSYPLDSTLTLRGLFKLDANNKLYADGDTYEYTGKVTRNTILRAYQSGDESLANAITDGTNTVVYSANASTEQAQPYQHLQQCDPNGTEEYVSTGIVPIGHNSFYPENLKSKIEGLPWNFASLIAPTESTFTATRNYVTGDLFIVSNVLYKATSNIANGGTITPNTNCTATTLAEIISALA